MATGRTTEARVVTVTTTAASTAVTAPAGTLHARDVGRTVTGTGIPAGTTIAAVASDTAATLSAAATASGTVTATAGAQSPVSAGYVGWSPETETEADTYSVAAVNAGKVAPTRITNTFTRVSQRARG